MVDSIRLFLWNLLNRLIVADKPYYEDLEWIKTNAVAWSRRYSKAANGRERGKADNMWHNWDVEFGKDLFSLPGNIHQSSER